MEKKKINLLFLTMLLAFSAVFIFLIKDFNVKNQREFQEYTAVISNIVRQKNDKIREFARQIGFLEKENADLKNTLTETRNALDLITKKLAQPLGVVPVNTPAVAIGPAAQAVPK